MPGNPRFFQTVRQGLLTLEGAFFDLTGEFDEYENIKEETVDAKAVLNDPAKNHLRSKAERLAFKRVESPGCLHC